MIRNNLTVVTNELKLAGVPYQVKEGKHYRVKVGPHTLTVSRSPSRRSELNARADVKRLLRRMQSDGSRPHGG